MARRGSLRGLTEISGLSDSNVRELALGNWHKLNTVLRCKPELANLQRMMVLELARGREARANFLVRLRSAMSQAHSREARDALTEVMRDIFNGDDPRTDALRALGLTDANIDDMLKAKLLK